MQFIKTSNFAFWLFVSFSGINCDRKNLVNSKYDSVTFETQLKIINMFPNCLVHVFNFLGLNINFHEISQLIILLRYFSISDKLSLYPVELISYQNYKLPDWIHKNDKMSLKLIDRTKKIH